MIGFTRRRGESGGAEGLRLRLSRPQTLAVPIFEMLRRLVAFGRVLILRVPFSSAPPRETGFGTA